MGGHETRSRIGRSVLERVDPLFISALLAEIGRPSCRALSFIREQSPAEILTSPRIARPGTAFAEASATLHWTGVTPWVLGQVFIHFITGRLDGNVGEFGIGTN
jgi:hypothetical protein